MNLSLEVVVFFILLFDSVGANIMVWTGGRQWWKKHFRLISRYFPATKGWVTYYLVLVLWMGVMIYRAGGFSA